MDNLKEKKDMIKHIIKSEMDAVGYICDHDNMERFLDTEVTKIVHSIAVNDDSISQDKLDTIHEELLNFTADFMNENYNKVERILPNGSYECYFSIKEFKSIEDLESYFFIL